jgi:hypothetical protein
MKVKGSEFFLASMGLEGLMWEGHPLRRAKGDTLVGKDEGSIGFNICTTL